MKRIRYFIGRLCEPMVYCKVCGRSWRKFKKYKDTIRGKKYDICYFCDEKEERGSSKED